MLHDPELHYLDNAATTIVAPEVADVIDKAMREHWANPSSLYAPGARSEAFPISQNSTPPPHRT